MLKMFSRKILAFCAALVPLFAQAAVIANSEAEFSGVQGQDGWYYGYYELGRPGMQLMSYYQENGQDSAWFVNNQYFKAFLTAWGGHPQMASKPNVGGRTGSEYWTTRRWVSDYEGEVTISTQIYNMYDFGSMVGYITVNNQSTLAVLDARAEGVSGLWLDYTLTLAKGDFIDFIISPNGSDDWDYTTFKAVISTTGSAVPEPSSASLALLGLVAVAAPAVRRRAKNGRRA
ncbi:PEP-CTERM sorting domain-containing protein [Azohydromonas caseinilytica]|uniref:PEP-CTERM sorting domain-containing protein n=1 Tax=Azohydromonas caseinilytica TaxID=2728836 RepID=A0A848FI06_9BURK|nr:PEP-CTERM sorting domain-containing protein [Azohydromonas caseinilytica]NML17481.1 PEP-CTERM sorting domain-containing protein [Azohydromonas caseinilytica]